MTNCFEVLKDAEKGNARSRSMFSLIARLGMLCAALMFAFSVHAQIGATSSVSGQVLDASHAAIVGATVTLTDLSLKTSKTAMSQRCRAVFV